MELYLQFGHGMKGYCMELARKWGSATVILSPRDIEPDSLARWAGDFSMSNISCLFDPQLYYPKADHHRLTNYDYWPETFITSIRTGGSEYVDTLRRIKHYNDIVDSAAYILPGVYVSNIDDEWFQIHNSIVASAIAVMHDKERYATICIPSDVLRLNEEVIENIVDRTREWDVHGYYILAEHPNEQYLVEDPVWLASLLNLCAGLKFQKRKVIVGYCSHQMLSLAAAKVDAIASGSWLNVRVFTRERFHQAEKGSTIQRAKWYYYPEALSEYKIQFLDIAFRQNMLRQMAPNPLLDNDYPAILFSGAIPSSTEYREGDSFKHYLHSLRHQSLNAVRGTFKETLDAQEILLSCAEGTIADLRAIGVLGQDRDFRNIIDVNRSALLQLEDARGFMLEQQWDEI